MPSMSRTFGGEREAMSPRDPSLGRCRPCSQSSLLHVYFESIASLRFWNKVPCRGTSVCHDVSTVLCRFEGVYIRDGC